MRFPNAIQWGHRKKKGDGYYKNKAKIRKILDLISGNDTVNMLKNILKPSEKEKMKQEIVDSLSNFGKIFKETKPKARYQYINSLKNARLTLRKAKEYGFKTTSFLWKNSLKCSSPNKGGRKKLSKEIINSIREYLENNSEIASNRTIKIDIELVNVRYMNQSLITAYQKFQNNFKFIPPIQWPEPPLTPIIADQVFEDHEVFLNDWIGTEPTPPPAPLREIVYIDNDESLPYESPSSGSEYVPSEESSVWSIPTTPRRRTPSPVLPLPLSPVPEDMFFKPKSNIREFAKEFPLPTNLYNKWKDGVKIFLKQKFVKQKSVNDKVFNPFHEKVVRMMVKQGIIEECSNKGFHTDMFCVPKDENSFRPIFNFKKLSKYLKAPKFMLPSVYQILQKQNWPSNLFWVKLDIKQAFFNININKKSKYILTIKVNGKYYRFIVIPFGVSIAPFVCQQMLNAIMKFIRTFTKFTWGHIDDIIIGHHDPTYLSNIVRTLITKMNKVGWMYNEIKSVIVPTINLKFLGCFWTPDFVFRSVEVTRRMKNAFIKIYQGAKGKSLQRAQGEDKGSYLKYIEDFLRYDKIFFKSPPTEDKLSKVVVDASPTTIGIIVNSIPYQFMIPNMPIHYAELLAMITGLTFSVLESGYHSV
ncbi:unnamed protein product [Brachionus calyciflorus]|uniref:Reverse transcriptase domain-containing protein n=1 Tax=Brachionus calyciflorus TaxID=104777 RepID=A0A814C8M2_9BILA|nr:unnamed protein product [Brachionus calyciflorus]